MARLLALTFAFGLAGCAANPNPSPRSVVVQQVVYVDRTPERVAQKSRPVKKNRVGNPRRHPMTYGHIKKPSKNTWLRASEKTAQR